MPKRPRLKRDRRLKADIVKASMAVSETNCSIAKPYSLREAQILIEKWHTHYNKVRPKSPLRYLPPAQESILPMDQ